MRKKAAAKPIRSRFPSNAIDPLSASQTPFFYMKKKFSTSGLAIPNLTIGLVFLTAAINGLDLLNGQVPSFSITMLAEGAWKGLLLFPFRIAGDALSLVLLLYLFWMFGRQLEDEIGDVRYNLYLLTGFLSVIAGTFFYPLNAAHVYLSVFLAVAHLAPDMQILLLFIIPVRLRWAAIIAVIAVLWPSIQIFLATGSPLPMLGPVVGLANYAAFFLLPTLIRRQRPRPASVRHIQQTLARKATIHRCAVCGITEKENPAMDFRYCVECEDREYCAEHLATHTHVRNAAEHPSDQGSSPDHPDSHTGS